MLIHLSEFCQAEGRKQRSLIPFEKSEIRFGTESFPIKEKPDAEFNLTCTSKGKVTVEGSFSLVVTIPCDRCLKDTAVPIDISFSEDIDVEEAGPELDSTELLYKEIIMRWPMKILCREDCKGLCPKCGNDLNEGDCGCDRTVLDPRMAAILDVFNNSQN